MQAVLPIDPNLIEQTKNIAEQTKIFLFTLIVSALTAILLLRNLYIQGAANKLLGKKFLYDIRPFFIRSYGDVRSYFEIELKYNIARNWSVENIGKFPTIEMGYIDRTDLPIVAVEDQIPIIQFVRHFTDEELHSEVMVYVHFHDEVGTQYFQKIYGQLAALKIDPPVKIVNRRKFVPRNWNTSIVKYGKKVYIAKDGI